MYFDSNTNIMTCLNFYHSFQFLNEITCMKNPYAQKFNDHNKQDQNISLEVLRQTDRQRQQRNS